MKDVDKAMAGAAEAMACLKIKDLTEMAACTEKAKWKGKVCANEADATNKAACEKAQSSANALIASAMTLASIAALL